MPAARSFTDGEFENGADPYSMFQTITNGYKQMPGQSWLEPSDRYAVIHYIREAFLKKENPDQHVDVTKDYLKQLPEADARASSKKDEKQTDFKQTDYTELFQGALVSQLGGQFPAVLSVAAGNDITVSYDLHRMRTAGTWQGKFLNLSNTKFQTLRGEAPARPGGPPLKGLQSWYWAYGDELDYGKLDLKPRSPAPDKWMSYKGRFTHGDRPTLYYSINGRKILETPDAKQTSDFLALNHTLRVGAGQKPLKLVAGHIDKPNADASGVMSLNKNQLDRSDGPGGGTVAVASTNTFTATGPYFNKGGDGSGYIAAAVAGQTQGLKWTVSDGRLILHIPKGKQSRVIRVMRFAHSDKKQLGRFKRYVRHVNQNETITDPKTYTEPGPNPFQETVEVEGTLSDTDRGYVVDTIPVPVRDKLYGAWVRPGALAFFDDGRAAVTTYTGDIWIVSGLDQSLEKVTWRRFATGFHEPLGARVIDGTLHVTCRDGIKRVHDRNGDGYADYIEQFYADHDVSSNWHAFSFGLEQGPGGNFYFAKCGRYTDFRIPGGIVKVSPDGEQHDIMAIGFRVPSGIGQFPYEGNHYLTASDNQGQYVPASKIDVIRKGGFYGYSGTKRQWQPYGGNVDPRKGEYPPKSFDQPMVWIPHKLDNSSGGQVWVDDERFGPLSDHLIHSSFGSARLYYVLRQKVGDKFQGDIVAFPQQFDSGVMRVRVNPKDGQVYTVGLNGWNNPPDSSKGVFQRLRYTGKRARIIDSMAVTPNGLKLTFNFKVGKKVRKPSNFSIRQWNYKWSSDYGSDHYHPHSGEKGEEKVPVTDVHVGENRNTVLLKLDHLHEVQQMHVNMKVPVTGGPVFKEDLYLTINRVPGTSSGDE